MQEQELEEAWDRQRPLYEKIFQQGLSNYLLGLPDFPELFEPSDRIVRCMDERTPGGIHAGGSFILMNEKEIEQYIKEASPKALTSHVHCGAAKIAYQETVGAASSQEEIDRFADTRVRQIATTYNLPYLGQLGAADLAGPLHFHIARCIYYVGSTDFNPAALTSPGLPPGLIVSRRYMQAAYAEKEVKIAAGIITEPKHALGAFITVEAPFALFVIGEKEGEFSVKNLAAEVEFLDSLYSNRLRIDTFSGP